MTKQPTRRRMPKRSITETRELMLRAATELACQRVGDADEEAIAAALAHVRLTEVAAQATRIVRAETGDHDATAITTGAIYQVWPTQAEFQADLLFHIAELDAALVPDLDQSAAVVSAGSAAGRPPGEALVEVIERAFGYTRQNPVFFLFLSFYVRSGSPRVRQALRQSYESFVPTVSTVWQLILDAHGRRVREPFTVDQLATAATALIEGFALRWVADPERTADPLGEAGHSLLSRTIEVVFDGFTEPVDDNDAKGART